MGDAAGREDQRAVGELGFVAGGRGSSTTLLARLVRLGWTSANVGMMPGPLMADPALTSPLVAACRMQRVVLPDGERTWTVLDGGHRVV